MWSSNSSYGTVCVKTTQTCIEHVCACWSTHQSPKQGIPYNEEVFNKHKKHVMYNNLLKNNYFYGLMFFSWQVWKPLPILCCPDALKIAPSSCGKPSPIKNFTQIRLNKCFISTGLSSMVKLSLVLWHARSVTRQWIAVWTKDYLYHRGIIMHTSMRERIGDGFQTFEKILFLAVKVSIFLHSLV